jgi:3-oxoadipate enol-lactonase
MSSSGAKAVMVDDVLATNVRRDGTAGAPVLVFVNSLGSDYRIWDGMLPLLEDRHDIIRYDKRGHGLSDAAAGPYTIAGLAGDLAAVMDALVAGPAIVMGISIGGMIAQSLAVARPDLVRALVLMDTGHRIGTTETWDERLKAIRAGGLKAIVDGVLQRWLPAGYRAARPAELRLWRNMLTRTTVEGYLGCCTAIRDADLTDAARTIAVPTLCLAGTEDAVTPPALLEELAGLIEGARFASITGSAHLPCIDQPGEVAQLTMRFIADNGLR